MKLCVFKFAKSDACNNTLIANLVTFKLRSIYTQCKIYCRLHTYVNLNFKYRKVVLQWLRLKVELNVINVDIVVCVILRSYSI